MFNLKFSISTLKKTAIFRGLRNSSILSLSTIYVQLITAISFLFIPKYLGAASYGQYSIALTFASLFEIFSSVGLNKVIVREGCISKNNVEALFTQTSGLKLFFILIGFLLTVFFSFILPYSNTIRLFIFLAAIDVGITGLYRYRNSIFIIYEDYKYLALVNILSKTIFYSLAISFAISHVGVVFIIFALTFSDCIIYVLNEIAAKKYISYFKINKPIFNKEIIKQTMVFTFIGIISVIGTKINIITLSMLTNDFNVGIYSLAQKIIEQGVVLIGILSIGFLPVFIVEFKSPKRNPNKLLKFTIVYFISGFIATYLFSDFFIYIIVKFFGEQYKNSLSILKVLIYYLLISSTVLPFNLVAQSTYNENILLYIYSVMALLTFIFNIVSFSYFGLIGVAYSTVAIQALGGLLIIFFIYKKVKNKYNEYNHHF